MTVRNFFDTEAKLPLFLASLGAACGTSFMIQILTSFVSVFTWRGSFFLVACLVLQICVIAMILPTHRSNTCSTALPKTTGIQWSIFYNLRFMLFLVIVLFQSLTMGMLIIVMLDYGKEMEFTERESTFLLTFVGFIGFPGRSLAAILGLLNKFSSLISISIAASIFGCGFLCVKYSVSYDIALVLAFLLGISSGMFYFTIWIVPMDIFSKEKYPTAIGIVMIGHGLGNLVSGSLAGKLINLGNAYNIFLTSCVQFCLFLMFAAIFESERFFV